LPALVCALLASCSLHVSTISTTESVPELAYSQTVRSGMVAINNAIAALHPACDAGGQRQACYDATEGVIAATSGLLRSLDAGTTPTRFSQADTDLRHALTTDIRGLRIRNRAIPTMNNADWTKGQGLLVQAEQQINAALAEYPNDAGLQPH